MTRRQPYKTVSIKTFKHVEIMYSAKHLMLFHNFPYNSIIKLLIFFEY